MPLRSACLPLFLACCAACAPDRVPGVVRSVVATTTSMSGWSVNYPKQRKVFEAHGRLWLFYADGEDAVYRTSLDGAAWSEPAIVRTHSTFGHRIGFWFDGEFLHYAHCNAEAGNPVLYRRGTFSADGNISWPLPEQTVFEIPPDRSAMYPKVIVDSLGRPWVAFMLYTGGVAAAPYDAIVTMSATADGLWQTGPGFPFTLVSQNTTAYPDPLGVALTAGKTYWVYNRNVMDDSYYGRLWNGTAWEDEERSTVSHSPYGLYNMVSDGDAVHLVFGGGTLRYRKRDEAGRWLEEQDVAGQAGGHASIALAGADRVVVTWMNKWANQIQMRERLAGGSWGSPGLVADESAETLANPELGINLNGLVSATGRFRVAAAYTTGSSAPYTLRMATLAQGSSGE